MKTQQTEPGLIRRGTALALALFMILESAPAALAQKRRGEPEANPQFQQQLQTPAGADTGAPAAASMEAPPAAAEVETVPVPRAAPSVQIGTSGYPRASSGTTPPLETRVTVRVKGAPLATFLDTISAQAKVNFIITEGLESRKVTAFLQNVTVREALQVLLEIKGLTYQQIGKSNTYVVAPRSRTVENLITRIYTLSFIPLIPLSDINSDQASITPQAPSGSQPGAAMGQTGGGQDKGQDKENPVSIINVLHSVLSKHGHVALEPRTNALIVTDIPEVFPQVEQIIAELDRKAPQVMIEAQIVEIDSSRARNLGFEWGAANGELASFRGGARDTLFPMNLPKNLSNTRFFDPITNVVSGVNASGGTGGNTGAGNAAGGSETLFGSSVLTSMLDLTSLKVSLRAMVSRSEARFLGKPKILTLNNKPAIIQIASSEAVGRQIQASNIGQSGGQTVSGAERIQTGLILKVTPQVNKEGYITMLVQPSFTDVKESNISTAASPVFDPISRGASTLVRIRNGQTLVMGGLLRSTETKVVRKVPILGYIPIISWFFTSTSNRRDNSDLVIFLTPTIVSD